MTYRLTKKGRKAVDRFIANCEAKRKEILDAGRDTADETTLPTVKDIIADVNCDGLDDHGDYWNMWGVTDHYDSDYPCVLRLGVELAMA